MYTDDDINKVITDKNGDKVKIVSDGGNWCDNCFYNTESRESCEPVRDESGHIGCRMYDLNFIKAES